MDPPVSFYLWLSGRSIRVYSVSPIFSGDFHPEILAQSLQFFRPLSYPCTWYVYGDQAAVVNINDLQHYEQQSPSYDYQQSPSYDYQQSPSYYQQQQQQEEEAIDDDDDIYETYPYQYSESVDEVAILEDLNMNQINERYETHPYQYSETVDEVAILQNLNMNQINESFQQASDQLVACSGLTKKFISNNLTVTKYHHDEEEEESDEVCVVCQVEFEKNERVGMLQCKHQFHPKCIKDWLLRRNVCPVCKAQALKV